MDSIAPAPRPAPAPRTRAVQSPRVDPLLVAMLAIFAIVSWLASAPHFVDYDSVQFALALEQHDVRLHHPQPPGYIFDVCLARALTAITGDARRGLHVVALLFTLAASGALYGLARRAFGRTTARWAMTLFLTSPVVIFHALVTKIYPADAFAAAIVALLVWRARHGGGLAVLVMVSAIAGLLGGVRPTAMLFALPLLVIALSERPGREVAWAAGAFAAGVAAWFIPQLGPAGGLTNYVELNRDLQAHIAAKSPWKAGAGVFLQHVHRAVTVVVFGMGPARLVVLGWSALQRRTEHAGTGLGRGAIAAWVVPPLLFIATYHFPKSGYALALWPALSLWLSRFASHRRALTIALGLDVAAFFLVPTMHICCREPWELQEARLQPPATLIPWNWVPRPWLRFDAWPAPAQRAGQLTLGKVDFYFDRSRDYDFGGAIAALRTAGLPRPDAFLVGQHATRAACFDLPQQHILHADVNRPQPFVLYQHRRGEPVRDTLQVPDAVRWLWLEGNPAVLEFDGIPPRIEPLDVPLARRFTLYDLGSAPVRCRYAPHPVAGRPPAQLWLLRRTRAE